MNNSGLIALIVELIINLCIVVPSYYHEQKYIENINNYINNFYNLDCPSSVYNVFILCNTDSIFTKVYVYMIPLISSFICINILKKNTVEEKSELSKHIFSKIISGFIGGFLISFVSLTINLIVTGLFFPFIKPEVATGLFPLCFNGSFLNCLYESNPLLFVFILIFIYSIFSGYYSIISFLLSYTFNTTLFKVLIVFLMNLCISFFLTNIGLFDFDISNFLLSPSYRYINFNYKSTLLTVFFEIIFSSILFYSEVRSKLKLVRR